MAKRKRRLWQPPGKVQLVPAIRSMRVGRFCPVPVVRGTGELVDRVTACAVRVGWDPERNGYVTYMDLTIIVDRN